MVAVPPRKKPGSHEYNRALVTIAFFRLNAIRDDLLMLRAKILEDILTKLELLETIKTPARRKEILVRHTCDSQTKVRMT